ncbi:circadian clock KaiB family protein [Roseomonas haemaphysalidis]|jgi:hypothetical protein|uniref:Circadian clock protein KaiB n=1 Tax=Roseomonas haemaphysalidis TaxID=2768162 RepID=A0ABS3KQZ2_9PROT|nr:circadian clock KaiB family protein [Roseomonas haemaphysalidis]MBO1079898.1 circadian clock protein KaiB [Roseomonas haemaphysalidis]
MSAPRLRLFVAGGNPRSLRVIEAVRALCQSRAGMAAELEVVDIYQQPELAERDRVLAAPTLLRLSPLPERRLVGDLSDEARLLALLAEPEEA